MFIKLHLILSVSSFILSLAINDKINSTLCANARLLQKQLYLCNPTDYCCLSQSYELQFKNEETNNLPFYKSLNECKKYCQSKIPPLKTCIRSNSNYGSYRVLNDCYNNCFIDAYNCPSFADTSLNKKQFTILEIILVVILAFIIGCMLIYTMCCDDNTDFHVKRRYSKSSRVHIARTSDTNYSIA